MHDSYFILLCGENLIIYIFLYQGENKNMFILDIDDNNNTMYVFASKGIHVAYSNLNI